MPKPTEIVVVSGKGGTGKTVLASSLAFLAENKVTADCDVDAPDMHLLLKPEVVREEDFYGMKFAEIDPEKCTACGKCAEVCRFGAVRVKASGSQVVYSIHPLACEGCGVCVWMCPAEAVAFQGSHGGKWFISDTRFGKLVHARLGPAQENSGKLVSIVRSEARNLAGKEGAGMVIIDGPPGIGCPVIASIAGVDLAVVVTEPSLSGIHDLDRVLGLADHFDLRAGVVINKYDLNEEITEEIEEHLPERGAVFLGKIPFGEEVKEAITTGETVVEHGQGPVSKAVRLVADNILRLAGETRGRREASGG
jgi:MinD superfamily P-loop ATPase